MVDMSDERDSAERDQISKNHKETLTGVDEESEQIDMINKKGQDGLNQKNRQLMKEIRQKFQNYLKLLIAKKRT